MQLQRLLSFTRKAVDEYAMIQEGDHIAVGISGGKDSLTLLYALHGLKRFYPKQFELSAVTVDLGFENFDLTPIKELCRELEVPYHIVDSEIYHILFDVRKEANPCSLCAKTVSYTHLDVYKRQRDIHNFASGQIKCII